MFGNKLIKKINFGEINFDLIEKNEVDEIDFHQTILNVGYEWWKNNPNPNIISYNDMIDYMDKTYGPIFGTLILIGKLNQQVTSGGFNQYYRNEYSRKNETDYNQSLHTRLVNSFEEFIITIKEKDNIIGISDFIILNKALEIFKEYLEIPIDLEKVVKEEVQYGNEINGFYFELEEVENDNFGKISDPYKLDDLDEKYYRLDDELMAIINRISKYCFENLDDSMVKMLLENAEEIEMEPEEWDDEITISDRIDAMIDPEMNIFKVREMFDEANDLSNTKSEASYLIDKFVENFDKEYLIIKKG